MCCIVGCNDRCRCWWMDLWMPSGVAKRWAYTCASAMRIPRTSVPLSALRCARHIPSMSPTCRTWVISSRHDLRGVHINTVAVLSLSASQSDARSTVHWHWSVDYRRKNAGNRIATMTECILARLNVTKIVYCDSGRICLCIQNV